MRELKFRAWYHHKHNTDNGWMEYLSFGIDDLYQNKFLLTKELPTLIGLKHFVPIEGFKHEKDFAIMQYTGLKDKNGEHEIYEGDKVKTPAGIGFIEWRNGCFYICWDEKYGTPLHNTHADLIEVVGNIYESYI